MKTGRNDPCPCGNGKKFKKCHMGKEDELTLGSMGEFTDEMSKKITSLPEVSYGRCREIIDSLDINELTGEIIGAAIEVHKILGPGLLESVYEECLCHELDLREIPYERQKNLPIEYKGVTLDPKLRLDVLVDESVIVELKSCEKLEPIHVLDMPKHLKILPAIRDWAALHPIK